MAQLESFRPLYLAATQLEVLIAYADHYKCGSKSKLSNSESYFKWFVHFTKKVTTLQSCWHIERLCELETIQLGLVICDPTTSSG